MCAGCHSPRGIVLAHVCSPCLTHRRQAVENGQKLHRLNPLVAFELVGRFLRDWDLRGHLRPRSHPIISLCVLVHLGPEVGIKLNNNNNQGELSKFLWNIK
mmetsp:Transcript_34473/g.106554  ORF Transcript_34473/g.106554 Transcript_34473/m.106554 type:complete len:101 (-) Transcript_34473:8-310(-)